MLQEQAAPQPIASFTPAYAPLNPRLLDLYARVEDRLHTLEACRIRGACARIEVRRPQLLRR